MKSISIGRNSSNDIVIQDAFVSGNHCSITLDDNGRYFLLDLGSSNGTYVNGKRVQQAYLQTNDIVKIGETLLPWLEYFTAGPPAIVSGNVAAKLRVGRSADNDIIISDDFISSHHAEIIITDKNEYLLRDLNSTNGTFVNDRRITSSILLMGDRVRLGRRSFDWWSYVSSLYQSSPPKNKGRFKPWVIIISSAGLMIIIALAIWGISSWVRTERPSQLNDTITNDTTGTMKGNLPEMVKYIEKSVFVVKTMVRGLPLIQGTGFFIDETGIGVTNNHVVQAGNKWTIKTLDGHEYEITEFLERNKEYDYAVFRINNQGQRFNWLKRSKTVPEKGEEIFVLGNPQGIESTLTKGIVSALHGGDENDIIRKRFMPGNSFIQMDVAISHGSSGSPVMNMKGEVVGIATITFQQADCINCNFAVSIQMIGDYMKTDP